MGTIVDSYPNFWDKCKEKETRGTVSTGALYALRNFLEKLAVIPSEADQLAVLLKAIADDVANRGTGAKVQPECDTRRYLEESVKVLQERLDYEVLSENTCQDINGRIAAHLKTLEFLTSIGK